ncbi:hypothetical protein AJ80_01270 [Polytolypa hystricis UAMH7299]|uniref:UspA domain-containing protein n=1 Tax=Polytolypa hystricis (strain UAMH7299) TaxID=1447883 RepID=A0A2B7YSR9_POLH7|nr:hypothetical protein AJ80_01270 [Polytolypa hystricis UAMH7299]
MSSSSPSPQASLNSSSPTLVSDGTVPGHNDNTSITSVETQHRRRSVHFNVAGSAAQLRERTAGARQNSSRTLSRIPSPPPPSAYNRGVSFDTFDNRDATDFSLTLNYKHRDYRNTRRSRTFLCGTDQNDYSDFALEWLIDELVDDGDEIVCLRVVEKDSKIASDTSLEEKKYRLEAEKLLDQIIAKNSQDEKAISIVMELAVGKVQEIIQRMIQIYEPAVLIVGTRGRSLGGMQALLPGSVSKYCLQQSPIPVIVVRPSSKREKKKQKRLADPSRRSYNQILRMSKSKGSQLFNRSSSADGSATKLPEEEAAAVAEAIGIASTSSLDLSQQGPRDSRSSISKDTASTKSTDDGESSGHRRGSSLLNPESPELASVVLKSPQFRDLDSPAISDDDDDEDDDGDEVDRVRLHGDGTSTPPLPSRSVLNRSEENTPPIS